MHAELRGQDTVPQRLKWVTDCPYFPYYQLSNHPDVVASLGDDIYDIEVYEDSMMCWIATSLDHSFTVKLKGHVFVWHLGVMECFGFDEHYQLSRQLSQPQHFWFNMKAECEGVRAKAKQKPVVFPSDTDDEVEIIAHSAPALLQACTSKQTLEPSPRHQNEGPVRSRPYLQLDIPS